MKTISQLAQQIRDGKAEQILGELKESPELLAKIDDAGVPLAHLFALKKQLSLVENNLDSAALESIWDLRGWTLAHTAATIGDAVSLKRLIKKNRHVLSWGDWQGGTPVHQAARHGHLDQFDLNAQVLTSQDNLFNTPIHVAALNSNLFQIADRLTPEMLLMVNIEGESPLSLSKERHRSDKLIPDSLKNVFWEAEYLANPEKRTVRNVLNHFGIMVK